MDYHCKGEGKILDHYYVTGTRMQMHFLLSLMSDPQTSIGDHFHSSVIFFKKIVSTQQLPLILSATGVNN